MVASESHVYVLYNDKSLEVLKADAIDQVVAKTTQMKDLGAAKGELTGLAYCEAKNEVWVSDVQGFVHILDGSTLAAVKPESEAIELKTVYGHPATFIAHSKDRGSLMAVGDTKGYVTVFDTETRSQKFYTAFHKNKVMDLHFTEDGAWLFSVGFDKLSFLTNIAAPATARELKNPNDSAQTNTSCLWSDGTNHHVLTAGTDCAVRLWRY